MEKAIKDSAEQQAQLQLAGVHEMVTRLKHADLWNEGGEDADQCKEKGECATVDEYHDEEKAREAIQEDALEVQVRSGWYTPSDDPEVSDSKPEQYTILLCTGGPAVRIKGKLNEWGQPETAQLEYQDWRTPWTRLIGLTDEDVDALLTYAGCYYFGE